MNLHTLSLIYSYNETSSNLALSCKDLRNYCWRNGLKIKTSKQDITVDNLDFMRWLGLPIETLVVWAISEGHLDILKEYPCTESRDAICSEAIKSGELRILRWVVAHYGIVPSSRFCEEAASNGHLKLLMWLRAIGLPLLPQVGACAAVNGHIHILKWLKERGAPLDLLVCTNLAFNGHLEGLKWARENGLE